MLRGRNIREINEMIVQKKVEPKKKWGRELRNRFQFRRRNKQKLGILEGNRPSP